MCKVYTVNYAFYKSQAKIKAFSPRGLGGNLRESSKAAFAQEVFKWVGESPPGRGPTAIHYNKDRDRIDVYGSDVERDLTLAAFSDDGYPLVKTADIKSTLDCLTDWLSPETRQPFLLLGPEGSGKSLLLHHCFKRLRATNVAVVHCRDGFTSRLFSYLRGFGWNIHSFFL